MANVMFIFPGQGSQKIGMVKEFYEKYDLAKRLFKDADEILNVPITKIIFEGPENKLNSTENTQPAIFLASYCIFEIIKKQRARIIKNLKKRQWKYNTVLSINIVVL